MFLKSALVVAALIFAELAAYPYAAGLFDPLLVTLVLFGISFGALFGLTFFGPGYLSKNTQGIRVSTAPAGVADQELFVGPMRGVVASALGMRLPSLKPAGAMGGHSIVRRHVTDAGDVTSTMKDPSPATVAHSKGGNALAHELPAHGK